MMHRMSNVGYGECHIEDYVYYMDTADINFPPIANANGPYSAECQGATTECRSMAAAPMIPMRAIY